MTASPTNTHRPRRTIPSLIAAALVILVAMAACSHTGGHTVKTVPTDTATQTVQRYADETLAAIDNAHWGPDDGLPNPSSEPCDGQPSDVYRMLGIYQVLIPEGQALNILHHLREHWQQRGYTITKERTSASGKSGDLDATVPADHYSLALVAGSVETVFVLNIVSPCYRSPTPLD